MFRLTKLSVANKSVVALATVAILLLGAYVIPLLRQELLPPLTEPTISVISIYPGASLTQIEQVVTNPLEQNFQCIQGVQQTTSQSSEGISAITFSYHFGTDLNQAQQTLEQQVNKVQPTLPANVTPQLHQVNFADVPIILLSVTSYLYPEFD